MREAGRKKIMNETVQTLGVACMNDFFRRKRQQKIGGGGGGGIDRRQGADTQELLRDGTSVTSSIHRPFNNKGEEKKPIFRQLYDEGERRQSLVFW